MRLMQLLVKMRVVPRCDAIYHHSVIYYKIMKELK